MRENRHLRFSDISGLNRQDLPLAAEVWLDELSRQPWVSREALKLAYHFKRYLDNPDARLMHLARIENDCHADKERIVEALRQMYTYGAITGYAIEDGSIKVSLNLTLLQRLRVLETCKKWAELCALSDRDAFNLPSTSANHWLDQAVEPSEEVALLPWPPN